ncbi:MAG: lyase family protein [Burkholderiaceae bacterium]
MNEKSRLADDHRADCAAGMSRNEPAARIERDSLGEIAVPANALYGAQTQRAVQNFGHAQGPMAPAFIQALAMIKREAALANGQLGRLPAARAQAIQAAADEIVAGHWLDQFPVDVLQTGSGTSTNMNMNEVLAALAARRLGGSVHPNDEVNLGQSSNDVIPSALRLAAAQQLRHSLLPALAALDATLARRSRELSDVVKTGRTHWMDAMPLTLGQEVDAWRAMFAMSGDAFEREMPALCALPLGGTAIGTGVNGHPAFATQVCAALAGRSGLPVSALALPSAAMAGQQAPLSLSAQLRALAITLQKVANDLRMMASGPHAGLGEIALDALQPGSSIMPGKVNPVVCEAVLMACARVIGQDHTIALAAADAPFQLNLMLPLIADTLLSGIALMAWAITRLDTRVLASFQPAPPTWLSRSRETRFSRPRSCRTSAMTPARASSSAPWCRSGRCAMWHSRKRRSTPRRSIVCWTPAPGAAGRAGLKRRLTRPAKSRASRERGSAPAHGPGSDRRTKDAAGEGGQRCCPPRLILSGLVDLFQGSAHFARALAGEFGQTLLVRRWHPPGCWGRTRSDRTGCHPPTPSAPWRFPGDRGAHGRAAAASFRRRGGYSWPWRSDTRWHVACDLQVVQATDHRSPIPAGSKERSRARKGARKGAFIP